MWVYAYKKKSHLPASLQKSSKNEAILKQVNPNQGKGPKSTLKKTRKYFIGRLNTENNQSLLHASHQRSQEQQRSFRNGNQSIPFTQIIQKAESAMIRNTHAHLREGMFHSSDKHEHLQFIELKNKANYEPYCKTRLKTMNDQDSHDFYQSSQKKGLFTGLPEKKSLKKYRNCDRKKNQTAQKKPQDIFANNVIKNLKTLIVPAEEDQMEPKLKKQRSSEKNLSEKDLEVVRMVGQGTFGQVFHAIIKKNKKQVALKKLKQDKNYKCREIQLLRAIKSPYIIGYISDFITYEKNEKQQQVAYSNIVTEYYTSNFYAHMKAKKYRLESLELKLYLYQMFRGLLALHAKGVCHRDVKPHNMLVKGGKLVLCDLGSAKKLKKSEKNVSYICSRCYRAPQLLFGAVYYTVSIDIWSAGCVILEILNKGVLFMGKNSLEHLVQIIKVLGTPTKSDIESMNPEYKTQSFNIPLINSQKWTQILPLSVDSGLLDLLTKIMVYDPQKRLTASQILAHRYFDELRHSSILNRISLDSHMLYQYDSDERRYAHLQIHKLIPHWFQNYT